MGVQSYFANMSDSLDWTAPVWEFEYDARDTYSVEAIGWPATSPLNATFYHLVTEQMLVNQSLVEAYNLYVRFPFSFSRFFLPCTRALSFFLSSAVVASAILKSGYEG